MATSSHVRLFLEFFQELCKTFQLNMTPTADRLSDEGRDPHRCRKSASFKIPSSLHRHLPGASLTKNNPCNVRTHVAGQRHGHRSDEP